MTTERTEDRSPLGLLTDLYQLTMAAGYWKSGMAEQESVFHLFFRKNPFRGGYAVACGLAQALDFLSRLRFDDDDLAYLREQRGNDGRPLFSDDFLAFLGESEFTCDVDAVPEGTVVFAHEPLLRIRGPLLQCQIVETALLTVLNFQTLIATKASRICAAAQGDSVLEFGLRRAQGFNGGLSASRAAYVGGCTGTSNVLAGRRFGIPIGGTHAHSWVMSFPDEPAAFEAYARALPNNCVFLVDTYDTLTGVRNAIQQARKLRERGHEIVGIRLDSGDLLELSRRARTMLDEAGFPEAKIVASNDLDEDTITALKEGGAEINVWGIGTKLATSWSQPALGGVYKLAARRASASEPWKPVVKLSEDPIKISTPGIQQIRRLRDVEGRFREDVIWNEDLHPPEEKGEDLLIPAVRGGKIVAADSPLVDLRARCAEQLAALPEDVRRLKDPAVYPVRLEGSLAQLKARLVDEHRSAVADSNGG